MHPLRAAASPLRTLDPDYARGDRRYDSPVSLTTSPSDVTGGGDPVEEPMSYARDFAPLAKRFFRMSFGSGMRPRAAAEAYFPAAAQVKSAYIGNAQITALDEQSRNRRADYESTVFALESARDKARKDREMMSSLAPVQAELNSILEGPADAATKRRALGSFGVRHAATLGVNPLAAGAFAAAQRGVVEDDKTKFTAKDFFSASQGRGADFLKKESERLGRPLLPDDEIDFNAATTELQRIGVKYSEDKNRGDLAEKLDAERRRQAETALNKVSSIKLEKEADGMDPKTKKVIPGRYKLEDDTDMVYIDSVINARGTAEERKVAETMPLDAKLRLAKRIQSEIGLGMRDPAAPASKIRTIVSLAPKKE